MNPLDAIDQVWTAIKKLQELSSKVKEANIRMAIADLMEKAANLKMEIASLKEENLALKKKLEGQDDWKQIEQGLSFAHGVCYQHKKPGENGPFCGRCAQMEHKLIYLGDMPRVVQDMYRYSCPNCKAKY